MLQLATLADREGVLRLKRQVHSLHISWRPDIYWDDPDLYPEAHYQEDIQSRQLYVAKLGGALVGYVRLMIRRQDGPGSVPQKVLLLEEICVEEALRGQGIGTEMVGDVQALARAFGCDGMRIGVYPQNDGAVAFYQKCGFQIRSISMDKKVN